MAKAKIEDIVKDLAAPIVQKYSYELVDVEFIKEGANWYLRVYIDKQDGITIDDCEIVSKELSKKLDEIDPIKQSYFLEVSSPGLDRPLKKESDFEKFKGETVEVKLYKPLEGKKLFDGKLVGLIDGRVVIKREKAGTMEFERENIAVVRRSVDFKIK
ncbi:MAG: ribosome maturation factor RimP [Acetivibrionales bacterium]